MADGLSFEDLQRMGAKPAGGGLSFEELQAMGAKPHAGVEARAEQLAAPPSAPDEEMSFGDRLHNVGGALNSALDTATFGLYGAANRIVGDPLHVQRGMDDYRKANPVLSSMTDAPGYLAAPGKGVAELAERAVPQLIEKAAPKALDRVAQVARSMLTTAGASGASGGLQTLGRGGTAREALDATGQAAGEGLLTGGALGALGLAAGKVGKTITESKGGKARAFLDERGGAPELANLPNNSKGEGKAALIAARQMLDEHEGEWSDATGYKGFDYRRSIPDYKREVTAIEKEAAGQRPRRDIAKAIPDAEKALSAIEEEHALSKQAFGAVKSQVDQKATTMPAREVNDLAMRMRAAAQDLETSPATRAKLEQQLALMEQHAGPDGTIKLPERQLNGLRRALMRSAKVGASDVRGEAEAPLREAAYIARDMVNEGPYKGVNEFYTKASGENQARRKAAGLRGRAPTDRQTDVDRAARKISADQYVKDSADYEKRAGHAADERAARVEDFESSKTRAIKPRSQLGLTENIPKQRRLDERMLRTRLLDTIKDTQTAGGNPAIDPEYLKTHPDAYRAQFFPAVMDARNTLSFGKPRGGDLLSASRHAGVPLAYIKRNLQPIAGHLHGVGKGLQSRELLKLIPLLNAARAAQEHNE